MKKSSLGLLAGFIPFLSFGWTHVRDVSQIHPYSGYIGTTDYLNCDCELWKTGTLFPSYEILAPISQNPSDPVVAKVPKGTSLKVAAVKRREGKLLLGGFPIREDEAVVLLNDPNHPRKTIQATISFGYFKGLREAEK